MKHHGLWRFETQKFLTDQKKTQTAVNDTYRPFGNRFCLINGKRYVVLLIDY